MRCTNCDAVIPRDAGACPECGVFARTLESPRRKNWLWIFALLVALAMIAAYSVGRRQSWRRAPSAPPPIRVVHDRPGGARIGAGATINEPEAILRLQRSFNLAPDCVAIMSKGFSNGSYLLDAINRCDGARLGRWRVDG